MEIRGHHYKAGSSERTSAVLSFSNDGRISINDEVLDSKTVSELNISPRLGNTARFVEFPNGDRFESDDNDIIDQLEKVLGRNRNHRLIHRLESHRNVVLVSLATVLLVGWAIVTYVIPAASKSIAFQLPVVANETIADGVLEAMDRGIFKPSKLDDATKATVARLFSKVSGYAENEYPFELHFRFGGKLGANAFALPGGQIIITDELIYSMDHPAEIEAIIAHEVGHVAERHVIRSILQNSLIVLVLGAITGDILGATNFVAAIPTFFVNNAYSRQFELEADDYAKNYMIANGVPLVHYANILERISESKDEATTSLLSTHPVTSDRVKMFRPE